MKHLAIAFALVSALFVAAPAAHAQGVGFGVYIGGHGVGVGIGVHDGWHRGWGDHDGWRHRGWGDDDDGHGWYPGYPVYPYPAPVPVPVNPYPPCYNCNPYYSHPPIQVTVPESYWDGDDYHTVYVNVWAYWNPSYNQYFYTDNYGRQVPVN